ncbi:hypothetical protein CEXT_245961 [Caerostris extrusa]|uniref:Uncharacterized protein n=1 Tax=Caerostris extrusa TaxID=172846 RepID=A0AAV4NUY7_CAEEX|nr:hypothetical protein CEXT_245961 [Caerostris extrusa]
MLVKKKDRNDLQRVAKAKKICFLSNPLEHLGEEGVPEMEEINKRMKKRKSFPIVELLASERIKWRFSSNKVNLRLPSSIVEDLLLLGTSPY